MKYMARVFWLLFCGKKVTNKIQQNETPNSAFFIDKGLAQSINI